MGSQRVQVAQQLPEAYAELAEIGEIVGGVIDTDLLTLIRLRASYLNGCAFCADLHAHEALKAGQSPQRLVLIGVWREAAGHFTEAERALLELVDATTRLGEQGVPDEVYQRVADHFSERQVAALLMAIGLINLYNRLGVATAMAPPRR
ncbi:carboxymuconolactone decarboxylase family protein [Marinactinospora thermotolerans]|uniref:carboxymuconolactone decarboxylase family protein n=1 Tax=Marinactinospora thermotolerans TaxID=531310 RepID=UPI003D947E43